ncbi:hypothetical protein [Vulcanococcus limneticus]|uniref:hypothetical protein n=1 Tax=Vulcanococcus limneticus TaxID=2170428 RepID=UPI00398C139E
MANSETTFSAPQEARPAVLSLLRPYFKSESEEDRAVYFSYALRLYQAYKRKDKANRSDVADLLMAKVIGDNVNAHMERDDKPCTYLQYLASHDISRANADEYRKIAKYWEALKRRKCLSLTYGEILVEVERLGSTPPKRSCKARQVPTSAAPAVSESTIGLHVDTTRLTIPAFPELPVEDGTNIVLNSCYSFSQKSGKAPWPF